MAKVEIKIGGFGGQGVILSGYILGRAATIYDDKHSTMIQSFGPEARGSACSVQLIVSGEPIAYPYITLPNILVVMSQEAYTKFSPELAPGGLLLTEKELVNPHGLRKDVRHIAIPATRFAEELGKRMVLNIVMMGCMTAVADLVSPEAMRQAVRASVPKGTEELNLKAFEKGFEYGMSVKMEAVPA